METAAEIYELRLQRGRLPRGRPLALACALRNLVLGFLIESVEDDWVAPAWVVVGHRRTGAKVGRVAAGREAFAADALFTAMEHDSALLSPEQFVERHRVR